jgi:hypothetical protein
MFIWKLWFKVYFGAIRINLAPSTFVRNLSQERLDNLCARKSVIGKPALPYITKLFSAIAFFCLELRYMKSNDPTILLGKFVAKIFLGTCQMF